jgi:hypothetical protein
MNQRAILYGIVRMLWEDWERAKKKKWRGRDENNKPYSWADTVLADMMRQGVKMMQEELRARDIINGVQDGEQFERMSVHDEIDLYHSYLARAKVSMYGQDFRRKKRSV